MIDKAVPNIQFHYVTSPFHFRDRARLKKFLNRLFRSEGEKAGEVNYIFCSDTYLLDLNRKYLSHNTYTDIITFEYSGTNEPIHSDIYISIDRIKENSKQYKSTFTHELHRVIFHGALHLCGYEDKTAVQKKKIREKENHYLEKYFVSRGTKKP